MVVFGERGKLEYLKKNLLEKSREPTESTHLRCRVREWNQGHISGRRALSPLHHPCSPKDTFQFKVSQVTTTVRTGNVGVPFPIWPTLDTEINHR